MITTLSAYGFELGLDPAAGGTVAFFRLGQIDILRTTLAGTADPRDSAAFPLVPFSGRISDGRFDFAGRTIVLPANMPPEPHAIHGHGWHAAWDLSKKSESHAVMRLEFPAGDWPWRYVAEQTFSLTKAGLQVEMTLENLSDTAMPAGLGWHPYFPRGDAQITCPVSGYWPADGSPCTEPTGDFDLSSGKTVDSIDIDTAFRGTGAPAHLFWPKHGLEVEVSASPNLNHWIVYVPKGENFFCVEPVSHAPNAVNMKPPPMGSEMEILEPGQTLIAHCMLKVTKR